MPTCPDRQTLLDYLVGKLPDDQSDSVASHLDGCPDCQAGLATIDDADDTLVRRLREPEADDPLLAESECDAALARAKAVAPRPGHEGNGSPARPESPTWVGRRLGEYELLEELGRGGMGRVYKARHTKLDRIVAIKVLPKGRLDDRQAVARFEREMKAVGRLNHPNIVQAYDARQCDDVPVLVMEYVDGWDLAEVARRLGRLGPADACELVRRAAAGLQYAHEHGLVHRDIKPSNVMLTRSGEVKLLDLGLARFYLDDSAEEMTGSGQAMGTADYVAPEQVSDSRGVDIRADVYSLGCTLYKLLAGRAPFSGPEFKGSFDKMHAHVHLAPPAIQEHAPGLPQGLISILDRMLSKNPAARFAAPGEVASALVPYAKNADLAALAMLAENHPEPADLQEDPLPSRVSAPSAAVQVVPQPASRRRIPSTLLVALVALPFFAGLALGIVIRIEKDGKTTELRAPEGSTVQVGTDGQVDVRLPGAASSQGAAAQPATDDFRALQGTWSVVSIQKGEASQPWADESGRIVDPGTVEKVIFSSEEATFLRGDPTDPSLKSRYMLTDSALKFRYVLNQTVTPKTMDLYPPSGELAEFACAGGIYKLQGDTLDISFIKIGGFPAVVTRNLRPKGFTVEVNDSPEIVFHLRRTKSTIHAGGTSDQPTLAPPKMPGPVDVGRPTNNVPRPAAESVPRLSTPFKRALDVLPPAAPDVVNELASLQGTWEVVSVTKGQAAGPVFGVGRLEPEGVKRIGIDDTHLMLRAGAQGDALQYNYVIDPSKRARTIDLRGEPGYYLDDVLGIYEVNGDQLRLCLARHLSSLATDQRPKDFTLEPASRDVVFLLRRVPDNELIQGKWYISQGHMAHEDWPNRLPGPPSGRTVEVSGSRIRLPGNVWYDYKLDAKKSPKAIDLLQNGQVTQAGIYDMEPVGELWTLFFAPATEQRPRDFSVKPDWPDQQWLFFLDRTDLALLESPQQLVVEVDKSGSIRLDGKPQDRGALQKAIKESLDKTRSLRVELRCDPDLPYRTAAEVAALIRKSGVQNLTLGSLDAPPPKAR